jgi:hypothetical protein
LLLPRKINLIRRVKYDTIIGLDISLTDTGMVPLIRQFDNLFKPSPIVTSTKVFQTLKDPLRQAAIITCAIDVFRKYAGNTAVVIEDYAFGKNTGKAFTRAELIGTIKYIALTIFGFDIYLVAPKALKKFMGHGTHEKADMAHAAHMRFGFVSGNDNLVDAFCLTRYLVANLEGQSLTIVKHPALPHYKALQEPATAQGYPATKPCSNLRIINKQSAIKTSLTILRPKPTLQNTSRPTRLFLTPTR